MFVSEAMRHNHLFRFEQIQSTHVPALQRAWNPLKTASLPHRDCSAGSAHSERSEAAEAAAKTPAVFQGHTCSGSPCQLKAGAKGALEQF